MMLIFLIIILFFVALGFYAKARDGRWSTDEFGIYRDGKGNYRYIPKSTDTMSREFGVAKKVYYSQNHNGEEVIKDATSGKELINCDYERAKKNEIKAKEQNKKYFVRCINENCKLGTFKEENAKGVRYCKVDSYWEPGFLKDANGKNVKDKNGSVISAKYYVKRAIRYTNEELGIRDYRGIFYYRIGNNQMFVDPDEETIKWDEKNFGKEKANAIERGAIEEANKMINEYKKKFGNIEWLPYQPKHNMDFNVNTTWSYEAMRQTIKNW